jgi:hypothetical protein
MAEEEAPPSRSVFVRFPEAQPRGQRDVEAIFSPIGTIRSIRVMQGVAFVRYQDTRSAIEAREKLNGATVNDLKLHVSFNKASRLLSIERYPPHNHRNVIATLNEQFSRFGTVRWIDLSNERHDAWVFMRSDEDAARAVHALQGFMVNDWNWKWEIEFHKVR